jgi:hypothetical protein
MKTYKVIRYYKSGKRRTILRGVSLEIAKLYCNDSRTMKQGVYFDGFNAERN